MYLDVTKCKLPAYWKDFPKKIPITKGKHYKKWDVDESKLDPEIIRKMRGRLRLEQNIKENDLPMGFNFIPPKGRIYEKDL